MWSLVGEKLQKCSLLHQSVRLTNRAATFPDYHCQCPWQAFPDENATIITFGNVLIPMCDKTQNLNQTESETFVDTEFVLCIIPDLLKRQNPKCFLIPIFSKRIRNIFQPYTILFISNKPFQQDQNECAIQILISKDVLFKSGFRIKIWCPVHLAVH